MIVGSSPCSNWCLSSLAPCLAILPSRTGRTTSAVSHLHRTTPASSRRPQQQRPTEAAAGDRRFCNARRNTPSKVPPTATSAGSKFPKIRQHFSKRPYPRLNGKFHRTPDRSPPSPSARSHLSIGSPSLWPVATIFALGILHSSDPVGFRGIRPDALTRNE